MERCNDNMMVKETTTTTKQQASIPFPTKQPSLQPVTYINDHDVHVEGCKTVMCGPTIFLLTIPRPSSFSSEMEIFVCICMAKKKKKVHFISCLQPRLARYLLRTWKTKIRLYLMGLKLSKRVSISCVAEFQKLSLLNFVFKIHSNFTIRSILQVITYVLDYPQHERRHINMYVLQRIIFVHLHLTMKTMTSNMSRVTLRYMRLLGKVTRQVMPSMDVEKRNQHIIFMIHPLWMKHEMGWPTYRIHEMG